MSSLDDAFDACSSFQYHSRRKTMKSEGKSAKETTIKEEVECPNNVIKSSTIADTDDEKEKKKDRELLVK
jgi:hypothetical protein